MTINDLLKHTDWSGEPLYVEQGARGRRYLWAAAGSEGLVSCTTVIGKLCGKPFPEAAAAAGAHAQERGIEVHKAIEYLCQGRLNWGSVDPEVRPRVQMFYDWTDRVGWEPVHIEKAFKSELYQFACTPDQVGRKLHYGESSKLYVLDIKPATAKTVRLQTAAQAIAVKESLKLDYSVGRIALHIGADRLQEIDLDHPKTDRAAFLNGLRFFQYCEAEKMFT